MKTTQCRQVETLSVVIHFYWYVSLTPSAITDLFVPVAGSGCLDARYEKDNLAYLKPYVTKIPAFRRIIPKGTR